MQDKKKGNIHFDSALALVFIVSSAQTMVFNVFLVSQLIEPCKSKNSFKILLWKPKMSLFLCGNSRKGLQLEAPEP